MKTSHFIVKKMIDNEWIVHSWHKNFTYAKDNADVQFTSGYPVMVIKDGKAVYQRVESEP